VQKGQHDRNTGRWRKDVQLMSEEFNIGQKERGGRKEGAQEHGIKAVAEDTGGDYGRSVWFDTRDGTVIVSGLEQTNDRAHW